jgi:hypothetical protein
MKPRTFPLKLLNEILLFIYYTGYNLGLLDEQKLLQLNNNKKPNMLGVGSALNS